MLETKKNIYIHTSHFVCCKSAADFLHVCKRNDPQIEACIKKSVEDLRPKLMTGVPEYSIPSLEPLLLKELIAAEGSGGLKITVKDVHAYGASDFVVQKLRYILCFLYFYIRVLLQCLKLVLAG